MTTGLLPGGRERAEAIAYHVLGSVADAEEVVQEAAAAWTATDPDTIADPEAWVAVVTTRRAIDRLRSRERRRETYVGPWLPEPRVQRRPEEQADPADVTELADDVSYALLVVLDRLTPEQRVAFVLHDVFAAPFAEIARVLDRTPTAVRQLASRARRRVRDALPPDDVDDRTRWELADAFVQACDEGDLDRLLDLLDPDASLVTDGGGVVRAARNVIRGGDAVGRFLLGVLAKWPPTAWAPVTVGGDPGMLAEADGHLIVAVLEIHRGRVTALRLVVNPDKLRHLEHLAPPR